VTAIYSSRPHDDAAESAKWGTPIKTYTDLNAMLSNKSIDVVSITSYSDQHAVQAVAAAQAGKHIILEKPMSLSWEDSQLIESEVKKAGVKVCVCFECRYSNQFLASKALVDTGLIGDIHYAEVDYLHGLGPWYGQYHWNIKKKQGGSSILTAGCHALDALLLFMGTDVEEVTSYEAKSKNPIFQAYEYTTSRVSIFKFKDGRVGKSSAIIDCIQPYYFHTHLFGSEGSLLDDKFHSEKLGTDMHSWSSLAMKMLDSGDVADHPYQAQFDTFFDYLAKGSDMPLTSLSDGIKTHEIIFAADKSAATGKPVRL
jgi:predicted dehydrogenase